MKIVIQNPHILGDSPISGIHDYLSLFLLKYKPTIQLAPFSLRNIKMWAGFLRRKKLPIYGWKYHLPYSNLNNYDVWACFSGTSAITLAGLPENFSGLKVYHVMDYIFDAGIARDQFRKSKVDYLMGYSSHDYYCPFFQHIFSDYLGKVIPFPFGISPRFKNIIPFEEREQKASIMGAVNKIVNEGSADRVKEYADFYKKLEWGYPLRQTIRENEDNLENIIVSYLAPIGERINLSYDSVKELNRYQLFINDDGIKHHPPARTGEGAACGAVMICSDHPCYEEFGWQVGYNCIGHKFGDFHSLKETIKKGLREQELLKILQSRSLLNAERFQHNNLAKVLYDTIYNLYIGKEVDAIKNQFRLT